MNEARKIYIDEYGDPSLETFKKGVTTHYILTAVLVKGNDENEVRKGLEQIARNHFSSGEIKSSNVGRKKDARRIKILKDMHKLPYRIHCLAVDKRKLQNTKGVIYKKSFIKYMHDKLYIKLSANYMKMSIFADKQGSDEFQNELRLYFEKQEYLRDFFSEFSYKGLDSSSNRFIQLADFVAGSLARIYDPDKLSLKGKEIQALLMPHILSAEHWPLRIRGSYESEVDTTVDGRIRWQAKQSILNYLEKHYSSRNPDIKARRELLNLLVYVSEENQGKKYIHYDEVRRILVESLSRKIEDRYLRSNLVGPLRDIGIPIVSGSKGLKIAMGMKDLMSFMHSVETRVIPQLRRAYVLRSAIYTVTDEEHDLFDGNYKLLGELCKTAVEKGVLG